MLVLTKWQIEKQKVIFLFSQILPQSYKKNKTLATQKSRLKPIIKYIKYNIISVLYIVKWRKTGEQENYKNTVQ